MKKIALAAAAAFTITAVAAPAAQAYDAEAFSYAAGHMLQEKDVPESIGLNDTMNFTASTNADFYVCSKGDRSISIPSGKNSFLAGYDSKKGVEGSLNIAVTQYATSTSAIKAFGKLKKALTTCAGATGGTQTYDDGTTDTWARLATTGTVPAVTITGVPSLFLNTNYTDIASGPDSSQYSSDSYNVYTLVDDVIITTNYYTGSELNLPTKKRKAINQVAFNAVSAWLG
jgi:hypothetical protein